MGKNPEKPKKLSEISELRKKRFKKIRVRTEQSQAEFAKTLGVDLRKVEDAEQGKKFDPELIQKIHEIYRISREYLEGGLRLKIPSKPQHCFGREDLLDELVTLFTAGRPFPKVPCWGIGGMGKTTVAITFLHDPRLDDIFEERRYFVDLQTATNKDLVLIAIADVLGIKGVTNPEERILEKLAEDEPRLIVLDNAETPLEGTSGNSVKRYLESLALLPNVGILVTLRPGHRFHGWLDGIECEMLSDAAAKELFRTHAAMATEFNENDPAEKAALDNLIRELAGWSVVIAIAGDEAAKGSPTLANFWKIWQVKKAQYLVRGDDKKTNLAICIALSWDRLEPNGRRLLSLMALLPAGIATTDLDALLPQVADLALNELRRTGGLHYESAARLHLLPALRDHLAETHAASPEDRARAQAFYAAIAKRLNNYRERNPELFQRVSDNRANLEWAVQGFCFCPSDFGFR
ncbi:MAG: hypothetical protein ACRC8S_10015 [Fimbriiglobus sp.]